MVKLFIDSIIPSKNPDDAIVNFTCVWSTKKKELSTRQHSLPYQVALQMLSSMDEIKVAFNLMYRVTELSHNDKLIAIREVLFASKELPATQDTFNKEILGEDLKSFSTVLPDRYNYYPCDHYLCEAVALQSGKKYAPPTSDQFLQHSAKSLAKFEEPYKRYDFQITPEDLRRIYREIAGDGGEDLAAKLRNYIAAETVNKNTGLQVLEKQMLKDKALLPEPFAHGLPCIVMALTIEDRVEYLVYQKGFNPFKFLQKIN